MIRDIVNAVQTAVANVLPVGVSGITPASSNTGSGSVTFDSSTSSPALGHFFGLLEILTSGAPGTATARLALDALPWLNPGSLATPPTQPNFDQAFTLPATVPGYTVPLPAISPGLASPARSGLVLNFSGNFNAGDVFFFSVVPPITFLVGEEETSAQDTLFPRVIFVPAHSDFEGTSDYAQRRDQRTQPRSILTDVAHFEMHCWGFDYDRTEILRDLVVNGVWFALQAVSKELHGTWVNAGPVGNAGKLYVLKWNVMKPIPVQSLDTIPVPPPFTATITPQAH